MCVIYTDKFMSDYVAGERLNPVNTNTNTRVASFFGTASYSYDNRYVLNANIRSDGANKFGTNINSLIFMVFPLTSKKTN